MNPATVALCDWMHSVQIEQLHRRMPAWAEEWAEELTEVVKHERSDDDFHTASPQTAVSRSRSPLQLLDIVLHSREP